MIRCEKGVAGKLGQAYDNVNGILHTTETNVVEHNGSTVDGEAVARCHENKTNGSEDGHEQETFRTAPSIHHPSDGQISGGSGGISESGGNTRQRMLLE